MACLAGKLLHAGGGFTHERFGYHQVPVLEL